LSRHRGTAEKDLEGHSLQFTRNRSHRKVPGGYELTLTGGL
jgi:hypothetical protein